MTREDEPTRDGESMDRIPAELLRRHELLLAELRADRSSDPQATLQSLSESEPNLGADVAASDRDPLWAAILDDVLLDSLGAAESRNGSAMDLEGLLRVDAASLPRPSQAELREIDDLVLGEVRERLADIRLPAGSRARSGSGLEERGDALGRGSQDGLPPVSFPAEVSGFEDPGCGDPGCGDPGFWDEVAPATAGRGTALLRFLGHRRVAGDGERAPGWVWQHLRADIARDRSQRRRLRRVHQWSWRVGTAALLFLAVYVGLTFAGEQTSTPRDANETDRRAQALRARIRFVESSQPISGFRSTASIVEEVRGD